MIECVRRTDYLINDCKQKGIDISESLTTKVKKEYYILKLRDWWLKELYGSNSNIPWSLKFMLSIDCLQLCRRIQTLKESDQKKIWESDDWIAEEKLDGVRAVICYDANENKFHFFSRNNSTQTYLPQDYCDKIYVTSNKFSYPKNFVLDCEVISTEAKVETNVQCLTQLQSTAALLSLNAEDTLAIQKKYPLKFIIFDCLYDGESLMNEEWQERHKYAEKLASILKDAGFCCELNKVIKNTPDNKLVKREFFEEVINRNGEGVVIKNIHAKYNATTSRTINCVKVKRSTSDTLTNDIDAFITDYVVGNDDTRNENMVVGFVFSVKLEKEDGTIITHPIATCSNVSDFIKDDATVIDGNGNVSLNKDYYFRVATVQGQNISARQLKLTHATIVNWRPEKSCDGCEILKESELRSLVF